MKTLQEHLETSQLVKNIVRSELNKGNPVFLAKNDRTGNSLLTTQPVLFGGEKQEGAAGLICGDENGMYGDTYSGPFDEISHIDQMADMPFQKTQE